MDDLRIARLARDLGDEELAGLLVAARREVVHAVPNDVSRRHLAAMVAAATATGATLVGTSAAAGVAAAGAAAGGTSAAAGAGAATAVASGTALGTGFSFGIGPTVAALTAAGVLVGGGMAASGQLPEPAQRVVADLAERIGLDLPDGAGSTDGDDLPGRSGEAPGRQAERMPPGQRETDGAPGLEQRDESPGATTADETPGSEARERVPGQRDEPPEPRNDNAPAAPPTTQPTPPPAEGETPPTSGSLPPAAPAPDATSGASEGDDVEAPTDNRRDDVPRGTGGADEPPARPDRAGDPAIGSTRDASDD